MHSSKNDMPHKHEVGKNNRSNQQKVAAGPIFAGERKLMGGERQLIIEPMPARQFIDLSQIDAVIAHWKIIQANDATTRKDAINAFRSSE
jgi:hypothetical protein